MKKTLFIYLFFPFVLLAQAPYEDGYIITNSGDTLRGQIKDRKFTKDHPQCDKISFVNVATGEKKNITPDDAQGYCKKGVLFFKTMSVGFENKPKFCQVISDGDVILYAFSNDTQAFIANDMGAKVKEGFEHENENSYVEYFLQLKNKPNSLMKVRRKKFEETTVFFFKDNADLVKKIQNQELTYLDIEKIVKLYNESKNQSK